VTGALTSKGALVAPFSFAKPERKKASHIFIEAKKAIDPDRRNL
jgi:hypothetical protein